VLGLDFLLQIYGNVPVIKKERVGAGEEIHLSFYNVFVFAVNYFQEILIKQLKRLFIKYN